MPKHPSSPWTRIAFSFPAEPTSIAEVRHLVVSEARTLPFSQQELDDIALAISEAFTNLVQHAPGHRIRGVCEITPVQLEVRFDVEEGASTYTEHRQLPSGLSHGGRGIPLLQMLIPIVEVRQGDNGLTELRLVKPITDEKEKL